VNPTGRKVVAVFGASRTQPTDDAYTVAMRCGELLAAAGFAVATGGYAGTMEAVTRGAAEAGGTTIGVTAPTVFPGRVGANRWVEHEVPAEGLVERIGMLASMSAAAIALPGSLGTLAELIIAWNLAFVAPFSSALPDTVVAVGDEWGSIVPYLAERLETDGNLVRCVPDVDSAVQMVVAAVGRGG
jgi:uncharacterized protein (TIGR00730 family)